MRRRWAVLAAVAAAGCGAASPSHLEAADPLGSSTTLTTSTTVEPFTLLDALSHHAAAPLTATTASTATTAPSRTSRSSATSRTRPPGVGDPTDPAPTARASGGSSTPAPTASSGPGDPARSTAITHAPSAEPQGPGPTTTTTRPAAVTTTTAAPPPPPPPPPADPNLLPSPGLESGSAGWRNHALDFPGQSGIVWGRQSAWAHSGSWSMRQSATARATEISPGVYGVAGSFLSPPIRCSAGDRFQLSAWINNLVELPAGSPGHWLEMFWTDGDGRVVRQDNGPSIFTVTPIGVRHLSMTGTCPSGATHLHPLAVGATNTPGTTVDFSTDDASLRRV